MEIAPKYGLNTRYSSYDTPNENWLLMQNVDMTSDDEFEQIWGCTKYHGTSIGSNDPTHIARYYNTNTRARHALVCLDDKIMRKVEGTNEFEEIYSGLRQNLIYSSILIANKLYLAHPDGLLEYDGVTVKLINDGPKLTWISFNIETNRAFGISATNPLVIEYTDDVVTTGGVPVLWNALNLQAMPPTEGDKAERLDMMNGRLVVVMTNTIYIAYLQGLPEQWRFERTEADMGCIAIKTWQQVNDERWFLGWNAKYGVGVYTFNGSKTKLLTYDVDNLMQRINKTRIRQACAEVHDKKYKISFPLDAELINEHTLHLDILKFNPNTSSPLIYGPHTYGFSASAVLSADILDGDFLIAKKYNGGVWVFRVEDSLTFYGTPMKNDGDLIPAKLVSGHIGKHGEYNEEYVKRFGRIRIWYPPTGTHYIDVQLKTDYSEEITEDYKAYMEGNNTSIEDLILNKAPVDKHSYGNDDHLENLRGVSIQAIIKNFTLNTRLKFSKITYEVSVRHKHKKCRSLKNYA